jgi:nucleoporin SEH1
MSWAPSCGRSYHLIATGARDGAVRIWKVEIPSDGEDSEQTSKDRWKAETVADLEHGSARVGMVDVSYLPTVLRDGKTDEIVERNGYNIDDER